MSGPQQNRQPLRDSTESSPSNGTKTDYHVGYKGPPLHTRFKPGQSGNPKGRPAGPRNHKTTIERVMNEKVSVREGEKTRHMTKFEAMLQAQTVKEMKGDARSTGVVINMMSRTAIRKARASLRVTSAVGLPASFPPQTRCFRTSIQIYFPMTR